MKPLSKCCNAPRKVFHGDEGTSYYKCGACGLEFIERSHCKDSVPTTNHPIRSNLAQELIDALDEHFPKGECLERGEALVFYAKAQIILKKAFEANCQCKPIVNKFK